MVRGLYYGRLGMGLTLLMGKGAPLWYTRLNVLAGDNHSSLLSQSVIGQKIIILLRCVPVCLSAFDQALQVSVPQKRFTRVPEYEEK